MGQSILVFISHSSDDKKGMIEPLVNDLEDCFINVWLDKRKILPGDNLRKSIFRDGLDKADVALIFFTEKSLQSSWVDREIKHVLREERKKGNNFDLSKIISIFDCEKTYEEIGDRYPELTDDLMHLMPENYSQIQLGQLISAIWSKYLSLQGGDVENQRQLLAKDREIFQQSKDIQELQVKIAAIETESQKSNPYSEFEVFKRSGKIDGLISSSEALLSRTRFDTTEIDDLAAGVAFGLLTLSDDIVTITVKCKEFFKWYILQDESKTP